MRTTKRTCDVCGFERETRAIGGMDVCAQEVSEAEWEAAGLRAMSSVECATQQQEREALEAARYVPTPEELLADPCTPYWASDVIRVALEKDCCDASAVFEVLAKSFDARTKRILGLQ
jgi:hypothetical protein